VFFSVSASDLVSKWQGEAEKLVRNLFELAREKRPSIVFIDEIDSLCGNRGEGGNEGGARRGIITEFLVQMQGVGKNSDGLLVLGATNTPWDIDPAIRRRFEKRIYIPLPEAPARSTMFRIHLGETPSNLGDGDFDELGRETSGMSGSDISVVVREALMEPLRKCRTAKFWRTMPDGKLSPTEADPEGDGEPPCSFCSLDKAPEPPALAGSFAKRKQPCPRCGAIAMTLYELDSEQLSVPDVCMSDFRAVMKRAKGSVGAAELTKFVEWTREFGVEGS